MTLGEAEQDAASAAARAGVVVRAVDSAVELRGMADLFSLIWATPLMPPMPHDIMRSLAHAGGRVHGAFREGQLVGASVAVFGSPASASCYSLITGVRPETASRGVGLALKLAQRVWALRTGVVWMSWTFDPLLRRNARFNISRLGAVGTEYLVDFYGEIADGVNDPETDRLTVSWDLRAALPGSTASADLLDPRVPSGEDVPHAILAADSAGEPVPGTAQGAGGSGPGQLRCWIPDGILSIRRTDPGLARRWRLAVREALGGAIGDGYQVTGLMEPDWYVLEKAQAGR
jgi:predicted GNAT superfamily acetyltransferase